MSEYLVIIEEAAKNYSAYSPDLPGCVATGDTKEETLQRMREAIAMHFEGLRERVRFLQENATVTESTS